MTQTLKRWFTVLQRYSNRWWYAPAIAVLAFLDLFLIVIPTDGLLISAVMLSPRRWIYAALIVSLGSSVGAYVLAHIIHEHGLPILLQISPSIEQSSAWTWTSHLMDQWGAWAVFLVALSPLMQHPAIALAALAEMPEAKIFVYVFAGRVIKYLFLAWLATHAPAFLNRLWGLQYELEEVGLKTTEKPKEKPTV